MYLHIYVFHICTHIYICHLRAGLRRYALASKLKILSYIYIYPRSLTYCAICNPHASTLAISIDSRSPAWFLWSVQKGPILYSLHVCEAGCRREHLSNDPRTPLYIYIYIYVYIYKCVHVHLYTYTYMYIHVFGVFCNRCPHLKSTFSMNVYAYARVLAERPSQRCS